MESRPKPSNRFEFQIAIICALGLESDAVEMLFDHYWETQYGKAPNDPNSYRTGCIANHNVVLAYMPRMGKGPAAAVAAHLRSSFENIRVAFIVGVCGGVPESRHGSIFLGDIIISESISNYDYGRKLPDGFISKDPAWTPGFEVAGFLRKLKGWKGLQDLNQQTRQHYETLLESNNAYRKPALGTDRLFEPSYFHKHHSLDRCISCSADQSCKNAQGATCEELQCDQARCIVRSRQVIKGQEQPCESQVNVHFGAVASGDTVMKSGQDRDTTAAQHGAIAFEMEGAGVYPSLQCIVVKGVCDYADSHKDKSWQHYAAAMAAACMKSMLDQWISSSRCATEGSFCRIVTSSHSGAVAVSVQNEAENTFPAACSTRLVPAIEGPSSTSVPEDCIKASYDTGILRELRKLDSSFQTTSSVLRECKRSLPRDTAARRILKTQRAKLWTAIEGLISQAIESPDDAQNMTRDWDHEDWKRTDIAERIVKYLGASSGFTLKVAMQIQQMLSIIDDYAKQLQKGECNFEQKTGRSAPEQLKASLEDLGSLVRVFSTIIPEHRQLDLHIESAISPSKIVPQATENSHVIQQAASSLYDALGKSCTEHSLHNVHLSLQPCVKGESSQVQFSVVIGGSNAVKLSKASSEIWINVESFIKSTVTGAAISARSRLVAEVPNGIHTTKDGTSRPAKKKRVRFHSISESISPSLSDAATLSVPDLFLQQNLCTVVQRQLHRQLALCDTCIGMLGGTMRCQHLLYINPHADTKATSLSLSELISSSKRHHSNLLGPYNCVRLAKHLATAVLYYHTTPWLDGAWRSEDVRFFTSGNGDSLPPILRNSDAAPYISTCLQASNSAVVPPSSSKHDIIIRNPMLFNLGVMLLELTYQTPFTKLMQQIDLAQGAGLETEGAPLAKYIAAKRLAEEVNVHISAGFKRIVKKCIDCDFGYDSDFQNPDLQNAFYSQVIGGLEEIEKKLQRLQLDD